jgi:hypothetical protein
MLQITLGDLRPEELDPEHVVYGWDPRTSVAENWDRNRGHWKIEHDARGERWVIYAYRGRYVMAAEITGTNDSDVVPGRRVLNGRALDVGHPIHDLFVGAPAPRQRNPIRYLDELEVIELTRDVCRSIATV